MTKILLETLQGKVFDIPPLWMMRQAGRYLPEYKLIRQSSNCFLNLCYSPKKACEVTLQPLRRYDFDGAILFSDILVVPHALGQNLCFKEGVGPKLNPLVTASDISKLQDNNFHNHLNPVYETVDRIKGMLVQEGFTNTTFIGFAGAPWTVATYMIKGGSSRTFTTVKKFAYAQPDAFENLLMLLANKTAEYLIKQIDNGVDCVQIFDSWAGVLNEHDFAKFCIAPTKHIVDVVREKHPTVPIIGFARGGGYYLLDYKRKTKVTALGIDETVPLSVMKKLGCPVQGNLDPHILLAGGDILQNAVMQIKENLQGVPYVFNLGRGIEKETPPAHVEQLVKWVRQP